MRRLVIPLLVYVGLLPIGAGAYLATAAEVATGLEGLAAVLFVTLFISALLGMSAMAGSYVLYFMGKPHEVSVRWMTFGIDLLFQAFVVLLVVAVFRS